MQKAYLAGGCFWCLEAAYKMVSGVVKVTSGYAGGTKESPKYEEVSNGLTGHAETVEIVYDEKKVGYRELLDLFFKIHDPSQKDRQGADVGSQYRSAIFFANEDQRVEAEQSAKNLEQVYPVIYTQILPLQKFWPAEEYHQNYFEKHPEQAYCQLVIRPKIEKTKLYLKDKNAR